MMTATMNPQDAETGGSFASAPLLSITVNLLPDEVLEARAGRTAMRACFGVLLAAVVGVGAWYYLASKDADDAATRLSNAQSQAALADKDKNSFTKLNTVHQQINSLKGQLATAATGDVDWAMVNNTVRNQIIPGQVALSGISDTAAVGGQGSVTPTPTTPGAATSGPTGNIVITGEATTQAMVGQFNNRLATLSILSGPQITSVTIDPTTHNAQFSITASTTSKALNPRFQKVTK